MMECAELDCSVTLQTLNISGEIIKRSTSRNANVVIGRNQFKDVILKVTINNNVTKYDLSDIKLHKRFVREGKATISFPQKKTQVLLSNCPPHKLNALLKCIALKVECAKAEKPVSARMRLLSDKAHTFQEISPLNEKDVNTVNAIRAKAEEAKGSTTTPQQVKSKRVQKRPRPDTGEPQTGGDGMPRKKLNISLPTVKLSKEQMKVLQAVVSGQNIFFTGSAGTGKSFLLKHIIGALPPNSTFVTASTGVAACHIGGTTLHQFAGIGSGMLSLQQSIELASRPARRNIWRRCQHLIVDEISMVDGDLFTKLEAVARAVRHNDQPFGGIQVILSGDFFQLPPVAQRGEKKKFCFQSPAWNRSVGTTFVLTEVRRQSDPKFIQALQYIRTGRCPPDVQKQLTATASHSIDSGGILATRLCTHKEDVNQINEIHLQKLEGEPRLFSAFDSNPDLSHHIDKHCPVEEKITLKVGAQVMLAKNLDVSRGLVNGARGVVTGLQPGNHGYPVIKFLCGVHEPIRVEKWSIKMGAGVVLTRRQLPIKLAWAISIHKSQGMSLDCVEISLSKVFECGQAYVALSRARSLEGLRVVDFEKSCVRAHPDVLKFYHNLQVRQQMMVQAPIKKYGKESNSLR
ncbi:ATP-dependent DNA helicase PIF1-like [Anneissia japonica]|uniref:ATP-dependent DNA helicase PIF1-like n=1 Tax=Anneissia japonica TaxID=1529436 RepID=UPI00142562F1|nr:ATP-dependent DNA helicase PIF1-like [Anneissia japonica]